MKPFQCLTMLVSGRMHQAPLLPEMVLVLAWLLERSCCSTVGRHQCSGRKETLATFQEAFAHSAASAG